MTYIPDRGDVIWLDFDPTKGSEIQKTRPALVLSPKPFNTKIKLALVAPITTTIRGHGFEVIFSGKQCLELYCVSRCDPLITGPETSCS